MTVSIAMATYNGETYIREQLQSIADQSHLPYELVVGDDGSKDATLKIIEDFRASAPFPVFIHRNESNFGYARNFLETAKRCRGDWIAFCDQDDVWLPHKLAETVGAINRTSECCMVLQNAWLCDKVLTSRGRKFPNRIKQGDYDRKRQYGFWVWPGFLKTVSKDLISLLYDEPMPRSWFSEEMELTHDKWTCIIANALGGITVLGSPVALYRRHEATVTGNYNQQSLGERLVKSRGVRSDHYAFLADVAEECGRYMQGLAERTSNPTWASAFRDNVNDFYRLSEIQRLRGRLYAAPQFRRRLTASVQIASKGGYLGHPFHAMGMRSALKDVIRVVVGSRL